MFLEILEQILVRHGGGLHSQMLDVLQRAVPRHVHGPLRAGVQDRVVAVLQEHVSVRLGRLDHAAVAELVADRLSHVQLVERNTSNLPFDIKIAKVNFIFVCIC